MTPEEIDKALDDTNWYVCYNAIKDKNATKEHIDKALNHPNIDVRCVAAKHTNATPEQLFMYKLKFND